MNTNQKDRGWLLPEAKKQEIKSGFYLVATPIGNLGDITLRALDVLASVDLVLCEDTRVTKKLLSYYGIHKPLMAYHDHTNMAQQERIVDKIEALGAVALVSDAGMPLISDPGYGLVKACCARGIMVSSLSGANAPLTALQLSGLPSDAFSFIGFLPTKQGARKDVLGRWKNVEGSLIAFETAPRLLKSLKDILAVLGDRDMAVVREISKIYEEARQEKISALISYYEAEGLPRGEIVLVIAAGEAIEYSEEELVRLLELSLQEMSTKDAASHVCEMTGVSRKMLYELALGISRRKRSEET